MQQGRLLTPDQNSKVEDICEKFVIDILDIMSESYHTGLNGPDYISVACLFLQETRHQFADCDCGDSHEEAQKVIDFALNMLMNPGPLLQAMTIFRYVVKGDDEEEKEIKC